MLNPKAQYREAFRLVQAGEVLQAEQHLRVLVDAYPDHPDVLHLLGVVLKDSGQLEESVALLRAAIDKCPQIARFQYHYGLSLVQSGMLAKAVEAFNKAVSIDPGLHDARYNLAKALKDCGDLAKSGRVYQELLEVLPDHAAALYNLANLYYEQDRTQEAAVLYERLLSREPTHHNARINLTVIKSKQGQRLEAIENLERILAVEPDHGAARRLLQTLNSKHIPGWHFDMLNDSERNDAYDRAITRAAATGRHVLEIGTGSGLLAMMAARAGAQKVTTCEMSAPLAKTAAKIIQRNGYADRIQVIAKKSTQLHVGEDLPEPADVLIAEVFDVGLLGEHFLPALQHAKHNLLSEDAVIIPSSATISAFLIECSELRRVNPIKQVAGFDLAEFDIFRPAGYMQIDINQINHRILTAPFDVCRIDFQKDSPVQASDTLSVMPTRSGNCQAIVFWFDLYLDRDTMITSRARTKTNHWKQALQFFELDYDVVSGNPLKIRINQNQTGLSFAIEK